MLRIEKCRLVWPDFTADYSLDGRERRALRHRRPSGGGKTTLLHMIAGFETPESGELSFAGQDLLPLPPAKRPVAIVFQDHNLFPHLTARRRTPALGLRPSLRLTPRRARDRRPTTLAAVGLEGLGDRRPGEMSGGQRQRVALARALVSQSP